jgi:preprotein translocase subunit SecD
MLRLARWKVVTCVLAVLFGVLFTLPNLLSQTTLDRFPSCIPHRKLNLGLDLQGGSHLLYEVDAAALKTERLTTLIEDVRTALQTASIPYSGLAQAGDAINVHITDPGQTSAAYQALAKLAQPIGNTATRDLNVTTQPGSVIQLALSEQAMQAESARAVSQSLEKIRHRVDALGTKEPLIASSGTNRIVVEVPGESDPEHLKDVIGKTAKLTFQMVDDQVTAEDQAAGRIPPDDQLLQSDNPLEGPVVVKRKVVVSGDMLVDASQGFDPQTGQPIVNFRFNGQGAQRFAEATRNIGQRFAIVLDGKNLEAPRINGVISGGSGYIIGSFTPQSANDLAVLLRGGALPAKLNVIQQSSVGAELGADAVYRGQVSAVLGFVVILVFIVLAYGFLFGGIAVAALVVNALLIIAMMSLTHATLTLPGVAGMVLSMALAVDASVLIYERMRDEGRAGHSAMAAADHGFRRALVSIVDANVTTLIAGGIMFQFGAGPVQGFAWSLSIGVFTSVFSAVVVTQVLLGLWFRVARPKTLPIL